MFRLCLTAFDNIIYVYVYANDFMKTVITLK
jgi:hypothetical protein